MLLALASWARPAGAQGQPPQAEGAPPRTATDGNGVDLSTGKLVATPLSIATGQGVGSPGAGDLTRTRLVVLSDGTYSVSIGDDATIFVKSGSTFTPKERSGYTLVADGTVGFTYTTASGDVARFNSVGNSGTRLFTPAGQVFTAPLSVRFANGESFTFSYYQADWRYCLPNERINGVSCNATNAPYSRRSYNARLASITNKAGDRIDIRYEQDTVNAAWTDIYPPYQWYRIVAYDMRSTCPSLGNASCSPPLTVSVSGTTYTDAAGRTSSVTPTAIRFPGSSTTDIALTQSNGKVTAATAGGVTTTYGYSDSGDTRTVTVTEGALPPRVLQFRISTQQPLSERWQTSAGGPVYTRTYDYTADANDPAGTLLKAVTEPEGNATRFAYDARGNVIQTRLVSKTSGTPADIVTSASYDATCANVVTCNRPNTTTDARGGVTDYTYDAIHGGVTRVRGPAPDPAQPALRPETRYSYTQLDANGAPSPTGVWMLTGISTCTTTPNCVGTADERRTVIAYGAGRRPVSRTDMAGDGSLVAATTTSHDSRGNVVAVDGPLPGSDDVVRTRYDVLNRPIGTVGPDPDGAGPRLATATRVTYNPDGTVQSVETGTDSTPAAAGFGGFTSLQTATATYDAYHRKVKEVLTAGGQTFAVTQQSFDALGRLDCTVTRMDPAQWSGQADPCVPQTTGPHGPDRVVRRSYDAAGRVVAQTSAYGTAAASTEATGFTANGQQATVTDANGNTTALAYDGLDRPWRTCFQTASSAVCATGPADYQQTNYAANGDVSGVRLRDGRSIGFGYDGLGRRATTTFANPVDATDALVTYTYDLASRLRLAQDANGHKTGYGYDALGRVTSETGAWGTLSSQFDAAGRRTRLTWSDGFFVTYEYDAAGAMTAIRENGSTLLASYGYDSLGRRSSRTLGNGTSTTYGFDAVSRLTALNLNGGGQTSAVTFTYNPAGQIASRTGSNDAYAFADHYNVDRGYGVNGLNQYTASGSVVPTYDARGSLTSAGGASWVYNGKNQLTGTSGGLLVYDPAGRLDQVSPSGLTWEWDGPRLVTERSGGAIVRRYVHGAGADEPLLWYEGGTRRWLDADERGSIVRVTNDAGAALAVNRYDEFGIPAAGNMGRFQYTGQMWMPELGLYYYKARMYSPTLGRFLQTDPIGYGDGLNWYDYVGGDPVNATDPSGLALFKGTWKCPKGYDYGMPGSCRRPGSYSTSGNTTTVVGNGIPFPATLDCGGKGIPGGGFGLCDDLKPPAPTSGAPGGGQAWQTAPAAVPQKDECAHRDSSGQCVYVRDDKGKLKFTPEKQKEVCDNYTKMIQSNREVSRYTGGAGLLNGGRGLIQKMTGSKALATPLAFDVFMYAMTATTYLLGQTPPPPGCQK